MSDGAYLTFLQYFFIVDHKIFVIFHATSERQQQIKKKTKKKKQGLKKLKI